MPKNKHRVVAVTWFDSFFQRGELEPHELEHDRVVLVSIGHVMRDTEQVITIAMESHPAENNFRYMISIPKACVMNIQELKVKMPELKPGD